MATSSTVTAGTNATATQYNNLRDDVLLGIGVVGTDTDGATVTFDMSDDTKGNIRTVVLGGNRALQVSNVSVGQKFALRLTQDGTGSRTISSWFSGKTINWAGGTAPVLTTTADKTDVFGFICTDTDTFDGFIVGQNI